MQKDYILSKLDNPWQCICRFKEKDETSDEAMRREVEKETTIKLKEIILLGSKKDKENKQYFYHSQLTDDNVNKIVRLEGKILGFFAVKELAKLQISELTKTLFDTYPEILQKVATPEGKN